MADITEGAAAAGHGAAGAAAEHATGMPQLNFETFPNQIFWLVLAVLAIYFILTRVALPRIEGILADRHAAISGDIAAAEELKLKTQEAEAAYEKALADARSEASRIAQAARAEIQGELDEALARADAQIAEKTAESETRIAEIRAGAMDSVEEVARDTAAALVAALGAEPADDKIAAAVAGQMKG
ncbi:MAG: F0F1 ATP synthase subunit B' [Rhodobacteraceae bacterium]|nr:F0F1 ATP synthase subunit B' [Paracoccaceae bacterium]